MSQNRFPPHQIIDDFLPQGLHDDLLAYALANEGKFETTSVRKGTDSDYAPDMRLSWACTDGVGPHQGAIEALIEARREALRESLGIPPFPCKATEIQLVVHRAGSFFLPHIDTFTDAGRKGRDSDRVLTIVYYFHARPKRFSGGELALFPFAGGEPKLIEPTDNRLIAFPSFAMHEVKPINTPEGDRFEDARFAVNVWLHRQRAAQTPPE